MSKIVYIAGPITGVENYKQPFELAAKELEKADLLPLNPCWQPGGLTREQYATICLAMLNVADAAIFLPGWEESAGCRLEMGYCRSADKPAITCYTLNELPVMTAALAVLLQGREKK